MSTPSALTPLVDDFGIDTTQALIGNWTVWFGGLLIGALGFGWLADRFGRKRLFIATLVIYSVATVLAATAPSFEIFLLFRFITAVGVGASTPRSPRPSASTSRAATVAAPPS